MASKSAPNNPNDDLNIVKDNKWALPLIERGLVLCLAMLILNTELSLSHRMTPSDFSPLPSNILMNKEYAGHTLSDCCTLPAYARAMKACSSNSQLANRDICPQAFRGPHVLVTTGTRDRYLDPILPYRSQCHTPWRTEGLLLVSGSSLIKNAHSRHDRVRICWRVSRRWSTHCHTNCLRKSHQVLARSVLFGCALELDASSDLLYNKPLLLSPALSAGPDTRLILC